MEDPNNKEPHNTEEFDHFASIMQEFIESFMKVMQGDDPQLKLSALELLGEVKHTMGDTLQHLMEKHNIYPSDLERHLDGDTEIAKKVHEVNEAIEKVNQKVLPEIEKVLGQTNRKSKKKHRQLKHRLKFKE